MGEISSGLTQEELEGLNAFLNEHVGEAGLLCPVAGEAVALTEWNAPDRLVVLPGKEGGAGYAAFPLTSPAGGVVLISAVKVQAWTESEKKGEAPPGDRGAEPR